MHKSVDQSGAETTQGKILPCLIWQTPKRNKEKLQSQSEQALETVAEKRGRNLGTSLD